MDDGQNAVLRHAVFGVAFGACFPAVSLTIDWSMGRGEGFVDIVRANPVQAIVALAPLVLGFVFAIVGHKQCAALRQLRRAIEAEHVATRDALTGQFNRLRFARDISDTLAEARAGYVFLIDLDRFKPVNDTYGHEVGDELLVTLCNRIGEQLQDGQNLYRLGGDEFVVFDRRDECEPSSVTRTILLAFDEPLDLGSVNVRIGASVGYAALENGDKGASAVLNRADLALYAAKEASGSTSFAFHPEMERQALERTRLEADIAADLGSDAFSLAYQPIVDPRSGEVLTMEALARWHHETRGVVPPDVFIPITESTGLIVPLGRDLLERACRDAASWPVASHVAVNVSAEQLCCPGFADDVLATLSSSGLAPDRLILEVTESVLIRNIDDVVATFDVLRARGVRFSLDDFGTGFASINHLRRLPLDQLKLDRSFLEGLRAGKEPLGLMRSVVDLARHVGLRTVVEGVETQGDLAVIHPLGVDEVQGYLIARPMHASEVCGYLQEKADLPASLPVTQQWRVRSA